jgi:hypothetical protein
VRKINEGNINVTLSLETMRANLTLHEHRVTDWIHPDALDDHDHDDKVARCRLTLSNPS